MGERDLPDFVRAAHFMEKKIPDSRLFVVPDVGHMSNLEAPDLFKEIVLSFLAELDTRTL